MLPFPFVMAKPRKKRVRFSPGNVSGLALWFDASRGVYTDDGATTPATADGDAVGAWVDQSAHGRQFVQATAGSKPTLKLGANGINGWPVVRADGVADHLKIAQAEEVYDATSGSVFAVFKVADGAPASRNVLISQADENSDTRFWHIDVLSSSGDLFPGITQRNNDTADVVVGDTTPTADTAYLGVWESTGTAYVIELGGVAQTIEVTSGANNGDWAGDVSTARDNTVLFARQIQSAVGSHMAGDLAELLVYGPQVSAADRALIVGYLYTKYGLYT